jgi:hypothetical protein
MHPSLLLAVLAAAAASKVAAVGQQARAPYQGRPLATTIVTALLLLLQQHVWAHILMNCRTLELYRSGNHQWPLVRQQQRLQVC